MSGSGYDAIVAADDEVGRPLRVQFDAPKLTYMILLKADLGHTDLQEDLEFHTSNFNEGSQGRRKGGASTLPLPVSASSSSSQKRFLWSTAFYAQFFDVDTSAVMQRCWAALYPRSNFLDVLDGNPDLYGPFWIATTVVLILFLGGTISDKLAQDGSAPFAYDFKLLSGTSFTPCHLSGYSANTLPQVRPVSFTDTPFLFPWRCS